MTATLCDLHIQGRAREVRAVTSALDDGGAVLVSGPAGIGKTTVARAALRDQPHAEGASLASLRWKPYLPLSIAVQTELRGDAETVASAVTRILGDRILFVDDLHWADAGTRHVLAMLAGRVPIVATQRPGADPSSLGWAKLCEVEVEPLNGAASRALARRLHPDLDDGEVDRLVGSAGGVPLLLEQLTSDGRVTPTLRAAAAARLARMPSRVGEMVAELALLRRPVPLAMFEVEQRELPSGLVVEKGNSVAVVHALIADAAIESLDTGGRVAAHLRLARRLPDAEAAEHFLAGGEPRLAAETALRSLHDETDPVVRAHVLSIAANAIDDDRLRLEAATALVGVGDWSAAAEMAGAVTSDDPIVAAEAQYQTARSRWFAGDVKGARDAAESGLALVAGTGAAIEATLLVEVAHQRVRTEHGSRATTPIAEEALAAAERLGVDVPRARLVHATALAHDDLPGWEDALMGVVDEAAASGAGEIECAAAFFLASHYGFRDRSRESIGFLERAIARAGDLGELTWRAHMQGAQLTNRFFAGDPAGPLVDDCRLFLDEQPMFRNRAQVELVIALCLADEDRCDEAEKSVVQALRSFTTTDDRSIVLAAAAEVALIAGDRDTCVTRAEAALALGPGWFGITAGTVAAAAFARFETGAAIPDVPPSTMMPAFERFVREVEALRLAADEQTAAAAIEALDTLAEQWERLGAQRYALRARWAAGVVAGRVGHASARRRLAAVRDEADARRLWWLRRRAAASLASLHGTPALSPREEQIVRLVGDGLTSHAIASRLGISTVTVETHVRAALTKLGATTRRQAVAILTQRGAD